MSLLGIVGYLRRTSLRWVLPPLAVTAALGVLVASLSSSSAIKFFGLLTAGMSLGSGTAAVVARWTRSERDRRYEKLIAKLRREGAREVPKAQEDAVRNLVDAFCDGLDRYRGWLAKQKKSSLLATPWFVIIGPAGAGKTELIRRCGWKPVPGFEPPAVGPTEVLTFWLFEEAVVLDVAGSVATGDLRTLWRLLLECLLDVRWEAPVNGLIVVYGAERLCGEGGEKLEEDSAQLAQTIQQMRSTLKVGLPVYAVMSKLDVVPGFEDLVRPVALNPNAGDRNQMVGWSDGRNPEEVAEQPIPTADKLTAELLGLVDRLEPRVLARMGQCVREETVTTRAQQASARLGLLTEGLTAGLKRLINNLRVALAAKSDEEQPARLFLRGVYLTTALTFGRTVDKRVNLALGEDFRSAVGATGRDGQAVGLTRNFAIFVENLFGKILQESGLVTTRSRPGQLPRGAVFLAAAVSVTVMALSAWGIYESWRGFDDTVRKHADWFSKSGLNLPSSPLFVDRALRSETPLPVKMLESLKRGKELLESSEQVPLLYELLDLDGNVKEEERRKAYAVVAKQAVIQPAIEHALEVLSKPYAVDMLNEDVDARVNALAWLLKLEDNKEDVKAEFVSSILMGLLTEKQKQELGSTDDWNDVIKAAWPQAGIVAKPYTDRLDAALISFLTYRNAEARGDSGSVGKAIKELEAFVEAYDGLCALAEAKVTMTGSLPTEESGPSNAVAAFIKADVDKWLKSSSLDYVTWYQHFQRAVEVLKSPSESAIGSIDSKGVDWPLVTRATDRDTKLKEWRQHLRNAGHATRQTWIDNRELELSQREKTFSSQEAPSLKDRAETLKNRLSGLATLASMTRKWKSIAVKLPAPKQGKDFSEAIRQVWENREPPVADAKDRGWKAWRIGQNRRITTAAEAWEEQRSYSAPNNDRVAQCPNSPFGKPFAVGTASLSRTLLPLEKEKDQSYRVCFAEEWLQACKIWIDELGNRLDQEKPDNVAKQATDSWKNHLENAKKYWEEQRSPLLSENLDSVSWADFRKAFGEKKAVEERVARTEKAIATIHGLLPTPEPVATGADGLEPKSEAAQIPSSETVEPLLTEWLNLGDKLGDAAKTFRESLAQGKWNNYGLVVGSSFHSPSPNNGTTKSYWQSVFEAAALRLAAESQRQVQEDRQRWCKDYNRWPFVAQPKPNRIYATAEEVVNLLNQSPSTAEGPAWLPDPTKLPLSERSPLWVKTTFAYDKDVATCWSSSRGAQLLAHLVFLKDLSAQVTFDSKSVVGAVLNTTKVNLDGQSQSTTVSISKGSQIDLKVQPNAGDELKPQDIKDMWWLLEQAYDNNEWNYKMEENQWTLTVEFKSPDGGKSDPQKWWPGPLCLPPVEARSGTR